jgi:hypothetical protein
MKRFLIKLVYSILILSVLSSLSAHHRQSSFSTLIYNDGMTLGVTENPDDLRSYGLKLSYTYQKRWFAFLEASGITSRKLSDSAGSRYDEIVFSAARAFDFHLLETPFPLNFNVQGALGGVLAGRLHFGDIQNFVHDTLFIEEVNLKYESEFVYFYPKFDLESYLEFSKNSGWFEQSRFLLRSELKASYSPNYESVIYSGLSIGQNSVSRSELTLGLGYTWAWVEDGWATHKQLKDIESGLTAYLRGHFGFLAFYYHWFLDGQQSFGGLGVDIGFKENAKWVNNNLLLTLALNIPHNMISTTIRYAVTKDFGLGLSNLFKMINLDPTTRKRENYSTWLVVFDYQILPLKFKFVMPYASLGLGLQRFLIAAEVDNKRVIVGDDVRFVIDPAIGLRLFNDGELQYDGVAYGLDLSGGLIIGLKDFSDKNLELSDNVTFYFRVGFTIGSSL